MATYKNVTAELTAAEVMALVPVLDKEIAYQRLYAGKSSVADELLSIRDKVCGRDEIKIIDGRKS